MFTLEVPRQYSRQHPHKLHYNLGYLLQQQSELEQAAVHYRKAILLSRQIQDAENCAYAHHNLGVVLAQQERWLAATYHYRRAIALEPNRVLFYCNLGTALLQQGATEAAIQIYRQGTARLQPEERRIGAGQIGANLYHHLGQALQMQQCLSEAIVAYRQALAIDPDRAEVHYNLGRAFYQQGNLTEAIPCFEQALQLDPSLTIALGDSAYARLKLGQFDRAMQDFRAALLPHQHFIDAYCTWIQSLPIESHPGLDAADEFMQARLACAQFLTALLQGKADQDQWLVQTLTHWANVLTAYGGDAQLRYAEQLYQHALQIQPQQMDLYPRLAQCLRQQGRFAAAIAIHHLARAIAPQNSDPQNSDPQELEQRLQQGSPDLPASASLSCADPEPLGCQSDNICEGLNCKPCLQQITGWFEPVRLGEGIYRLSRRSSSPEADLLSDQSTGGTSIGAIGGFAVPYRSNRSIYTIPDGRVWVSPQTSAWQACRAVAVFSSEGELMPHLSRSYPGQLPGCQHPDQLLHQIEAQLPKPMPEPQRIKGSVAVLSSLSSNIYFHWMTDLLPRLELLRRQIDLQQIDYFLVNSYQRSFQQETLQAFGIPSEKMIESDRLPCIQADRLIVPEFAGDLGWVQPWTIQFLRNQFLPGDDRSPDPDAQPIHSQNAFPFIYLSRSDAGYRRLMNEDAVLDYLQSYGFVSLTLDSLSVSQQAALFANAQVIVAPHGSSLTNLVFCQPGTQVIELTSPHYLRHYYWHISRSLNLDHFVIQGEVLSCHFLRQLMYPNPLLEDIWIDVNRLHQVIPKAVQKHL